MMEENLRRALQVSRGNVSIVVTRPIRFAFIALTVLILVAMILPAVRQRRGDIAG